MLILLFPSNELNRLIEALQETGSVAVLEGSWPAHNRSELSKVGLQCPARQGLANGIRCELIAARTKYSSSFFKAACGQGNIPRDHDVVRRDVLNDPIISSIESSMDDHEFAPVPMGNVNPRVGDYCDMESVSLSHTVHFLLHRAGIGINEYLKHIGPFNLEPAT
jgi:hypothetical protein